MLVEFLSLADVRKMSKSVMIGSVITIINAGNILFSNVEA